MRGQSHYGLSLSPVDQTPPRHSPELRQTRHLDIHRCSRSPRHVRQIWHSHDCRPTRQWPQAAAQAADDERLAEANRVALGVTQIRHVVANPSTLRLSRVTVMPKGTICYEFHLQNSRGVMYVRTAVMDGAVPQFAGSDGFTALWTRRCAHQSSGRDITSEVENVMHRSTR
jgi:hypothetical protein